MPPTAFQKNIMLSPSLMCGDLLNLGDQIMELKKIGIDYLHIDIADMHFVPNITLGFDLIKQVSSLGIPLDIHLMVDNPLKVIAKLKLTKNDLVSFHVNTKSNVLETIGAIRQLGCKAGLVLSPNMSRTDIEPFLHQIDFVYVLCVQPGFAGQGFIADSYEKVKELVESDSGNAVGIGVDGAIGYDQIEKFYAMGVRLFVLGSTILFDDNFQKNLHQIKNFVNKIQTERQ